MNHLVNDSKSSVASIKTSSSSIIGVNGDGNVGVHNKNVTDTMSDSATISRSTSDKYNTNHHKTDPNINNSLAVIVSLVSGAAAGALAKSSIAPLDRAKINFQIKKDIPYSFKAAAVFLKNTYTNEGFLALWRGNSATMARIIPYAAIQFTAHEQWKKVLRVDQGESTSGRRFLAGSLAGITSQSLTYPLDLARARMAVTDKYTGYKTLRQVFIRIWIDEGPQTLLRGYWATLLGVIPYAGASFFTYETLKKKYFDVYGDNKPNAFYKLGFGACAGVIGQSSSYPLDIVRRRMQTVGVIKGTENQYKTIFSTLKSIYRDEGIKGGFFKGLSMNWIKGPIAVGISFSTYDFIKEFLQVKAGVIK
ncbi:mitochondrial coenzyme A transporter SLC25A42 [Bradysia coprophila]|uniref:mitochondrial coenzyme A transporter SLC25A42 n=1 Tax=Bradysia coprophila TaxID=38358 RepID=UPI00187D83F9|nr:mitochondrial coenzyme A transporter SLC25A42 [Bradysia coprophila]XP_037030472.1 mitochondrial coenzyme A transporter SLC25A42 [Bradysia coprophila]